MNKLSFKFRATAAGAARIHVLHTLEERGAKAVRPLFPEETDPEVTSLYIVECEGDSAMKGLLDWLHQQSAVEYAEGPPIRKLQHPM